MKQFAPHISRKAQSSPDQYLQSSVRVIEGSGRFGEKKRPFNNEAAIEQFLSWVFAAVNINATALASLPIRLFVRNEPGRAKAWRTRRVSKRLKRYLYGDASGPRGMVTPGKHTMRKIIEFGDDFEEVTENHPILDLLRTVNPWFNGYDLFELMATYLELVGNAYLHPVINDLGVPGELWPMPSQWVFVVPDRDEFISGYVYGRDSVTQQEFAVDEVIHFRTPNPGRDGLYYGMGKVQAGWGVVSLNDSNHQMDLAMSDNHARPDYLMVVKQGTGTDQLDRFEANVESKLRGARKSGKFLSITGDVELMPLNFPPKDLAGREEVVEEIAAVFGVPVSMLLPNDPNLASSKTGYAQWRESTILPMAKLIEQKLNEVLLPMFGIEGDAVLAFDNPVPADKAFELDEQTRLSTGAVLTHNEVREARGEEPHPDPMADKLLFNGQPIGVQPNPLAGFGLSAPQSPRPATPQEAARIQIENRSTGLQDSDIEKIVNKLKGVIDEKSNSNTGHATVSDTPVVVSTGGFTVDGPLQPDRQSDGVGDEPISDDTTAQAKTAEPDGQEALGNTEKCTHRHDAKVVNQSDALYKVLAEQDIREDQPQSPESRLRAAIQEVFDDVSSDVEAMISKRKDGGIRVKVTRNDLERITRRLADMEGQLEEALLDPLSDMLKEAFLRGLEDIGVEGFDITSNEVQDFIKSRTTILSGELSNVTRAKVESVLQEGIGSGATPADLKRSIDETGAFSRARSEAIARTESADAFVQGKKESWRQSGVVRGVQWLLAPNACEFCRALAAKFNNRTIGLDDSFFKLGDVVQGVEGGQLKVNFRDIQGPPLHPNDRCDLVAVLEDASNDS